MEFGVEYIGYEPASTGWSGSPTSTTAIPLFVLTTKAYRPETAIATLMSFSGSEATTAGALGFEASTTCSPDVPAAMNPKVPRMARPTVAPGTTTAPSGAVGVRLSTTSADVPTWFLVSYALATRCGVVSLPGIGT